jgi:hypothetical protein
MAAVVLCIEEQYVSLSHVCRYAVKKDGVSTLLHVFVQEDFVSRAGKRIPQDKRI